jgi:hypothetical protein
VEAVLKHQLDRLHVEGVVIHHQDLVATSY